MQMKLVMYEYISDHIILTPVGHSMHLTAAVDGYAQHDHFIIALHGFTHRSVRQERQVRDHNAVRFLDVVQFLEGRSEETVSRFQDLVSCLYLLTTYAASV